MEDCFVATLLAETFGCHSEGSEESLLFSSLRSTAGAVAVA